jgi:hypothetical protein
MKIDNRETRGRKRSIKISTVMSFSAENRKLHREIDIDLYIDIHTHARTWICRKRDRTREKKNTAENLIINLWSFFALE